MMDYAAYKGRGIGKTAFLNFMKKKINKDLGNEITHGDGVIYAVYVAPSADKNNRTLSHIAHSIFDAMEKEDLFLMVFCRLRALSGLTVTDTTNAVSITDIRCIRFIGIDLQDNYIK